MQDKKVTTIPAIRNRFTTQPICQQQKRRVAAYARVSTDHEEQLTSYEAQVDYYTRYIKSREDWEFVHVYADEGISATGISKREGFKTMVEDALLGRIDLIVTKSVSRFARNTVDSLSTIRKLKEKGCECYFEKENIWTFDSKGELLITIMSSLAQEESRSISENVTWGQRKRFSDGKVSVPYSRFLGYDKGEDGSMVLNEEEAKIVRRIYGLFLQGHSPYAIAKRLTAEEIPTPGGKEKWHSCTIKSILMNEKYKGDALLQKSYTIDFLTKKKKRNEGEIPQYYVENSHEAIISPAIFEKVQYQMKMYHSEHSRLSSISPFSSKIKCGDCGSWYGSKVWHSNDKYRRIVWQCNHKFEGEKKCSTPHLEEEKIKSLFVEAVNGIFKEKHKILEDYQEIKDSLLDISVVEKDEVSNILIKQKKERNYNIVVIEDEINNILEKQEEKRKKIEKFLAELKTQKGLLVKFREEDWYSLIEYVTVYSKEDIRFTFKNGIEKKV